MRHHSIGMRDLGHDVRYAVRAALRDRWFTTVAAGTLALSIGLNATLFTIVSGMDNIPPVDHPERLVSVDSIDGTGSPLGVSYADVIEWIVGVTPTVRQHYAEAIDAVVYVPYRSNPGTGMVLLTRAARDPAALTTTLREQVHQLDPDLPLVDVRTLASLVDGTRFANKVFAALFSIAAVLALLLAAIGLHAVTTYAIARRTAEIGIRMALGARASQVIWLFVAQTAAPLAAGFIAGLVGAFGVGRFVSGMLIGTSPHDPATLTAVSVTLVVVVLTAAFVPARRAAQIDPIIALRYE